MRPVNLIPPEDRRGDRAPLRTGAIPYVIVGALAAALLGVTAVVLTNNQVSDREDQVASLQAEQQAAQARADALQPYAEFASLSTSRASTVTSLAQSRFDWDRVLPELALVIPDDVWLTQLSGTVSPEVQVNGAADISLRSEAAGPALSLVGCASGHDEVAAFLQALKDIDGVTRAGIEVSERPGKEADSGTASDCRTRNFITQFRIVAAFDAVAVPLAGEVPPPDPSTATPASATDEGPIEDAEADEQQARDSTEHQSDKARNAVNIIPGTTAP